MSTMEYETETRSYEDEDRGYDRDRSRSPREERNSGEAEMRARSASPNGREPNIDRPAANEDRQQEDSGSVNPGSNLFVTGIHPRLTEEAVTRLFEKYGSVEKCQIMRDPHTGDSRGFGFVKMVTSDEADAAKDGLQGVVHEGRTLSIEKARRARPRTPTPGKYYGPPKRDDFRGPPRRGGGRYGRDSYDDRRSGRRDDNYGGYRSRYDDRYDDRGSGRRERDDYGGRGVDRYAGGREAGGRDAGGRDDRYGRGDDRRAYYDRPSRGYGGGGGGGGAGYGDAPPPAEDRGEAYGGGSRGYEDRGATRYSRDPAPPY